METGRREDDYEAENLKGMEGGVKGLRDDRVKKCGRK